VLAEKYRLWREAAEDYRQCHPDEKISDDLDHGIIMSMAYSGFEAAMYKAAKKNVRTGSRENPVLAARPYASN
jgi:hypothetical protein